MSNVYLAMSPSSPEYSNTKYYPQSQIFTDEISLARYIQQQWDCYILTGLQKVESVEATVIVKEPE